jgi:hypothetical protein
MTIKNERVHIGDPKVLERLDAFSAPRLVEFADPDPCQQWYMKIFSDDKER